MQLNIPNELLVTAKGYRSIGLQLNMNFEYNFNTHLEYPM